MTHPQADTHKASSPAARLAALLAALVALSLLTAAPASAAYEQVGCFAGQLPGLNESCKPKQSGEEFSEEVQLGGISAMAVNPGGVGGVEKGTLYVIASTAFAGPWVEVYEPALDGGLSFVEAWQWLPEQLPGPPPHCGRALVTKCQPKVEAQPQAFGLGVDPTNGNVYALTAAEAGFHSGPKLVTEYDAHGGEITRFGEFEAEPWKPTSESSSKIHLSNGFGQLAVDGSGNAYVFDINNSDDFYHRLMVFEPCTPGDYTSYCYAGPEHDIGAGFQNGTNSPPETDNPTKPAVDAAGHVYTLTSNQIIQEFDPAHSLSTPICTFEFEKGGVDSMAIKPDGGLFFFSEKKEPGFQTKLVHELAPCQNGTFKEVGKFEVKPERADINAMAFDPLRQFAPDREAGMLYGGAPNPVPAVGPGEPGQSALGYAFAPPEEQEEHPPVVESESASGVTATSARLHAVIDPINRPTHYAFQYLSDAQFQANSPSDRFAGASEAPLGGAEIKGGSVGVAVAVAATGLLPATKYHFRVVASNECVKGKECPSEGADKVFTTFAVLAPGLPDHRAYELVSPAQKNGAQVIPADSSIGSCGFPECKPGFSYTRFPPRVSSDGEAIAYEGQPFSPSGGVATENEYLARRGPGGWQSVNLTPPLLSSKGAASGKGYVAFDPGLGQALLQQGLPSLSAAAPAEYPNFYLQPTATPLALRNLLTEAPPNRAPGASGVNRLELTYAGASVNLVRVFFGANDALTPEATEGPLGKTNLYEWENGQLRLVNVGPNGEALPGARFGSPASLAGAISTDGSHAFWTSAAGQLYVRVNHEETKRIEDPGAFLVGSANGSRAVLSDGCLYELEAEGCEDLTAGKGGFKAVLGHSEDLSTVYFVLDPAAGTEALSNGTADLTKGSDILTNVHSTSGAFAVGQRIEGSGIPAGATITAVGAGTLDLSAPAEAEAENVALIAGVPLAAEEENGEGAKPKLSGFNLYAWNEGSTSFLATMAPADSTSWGSSEASPNGNWFAFLSKAPLTGYDNTGPCETEGGSGPCREAFLYDAASRSLSCLSCDPSGASSLGETVLPEIEGLTLANSSYQPRFLIDSGRFYFDTQNSLTPADTNAGVEDVYEFEPNGVGTCASANGCVSLISGGREAGDSNFLSMDGSGDNVFFTTRDRLVPADKDQLIDLYDARVNGGIASESEPPPSPCAGEACQPAQPPLAETQPNSSGSTEGNVKPKCKKGHVKRHGHCVKKGKHKGKKHKHKRHKQKQGGSK